MQRPHQIQDLLAHADWLNALAARLVRDGDADDMVQETWKAALSPSSAAPVEAGPARAWLTTVTRNFARRRWRRDAARRAREQEAGSSGEAVATSPEEVLVRAQLQGALADQVLALDEPFRSAVVLRYYEGQSAADIARALGVPAGTVRWRLKEGIDRLRARMDAKYDGDRERWRAIVAVVAVPAVTGGKAVMVATTKAKAAIAGLAVLLLAAAGVVFFLARGDGAGPQWTGPRARPAVAPGERRAAVPPSSRVLMAEGGTTASGIAGVVKDPSGAPVEGALVALSRKPTPGALDGNRGLAATARSDAAGRFAFEDPTPGVYRLTASAPGHQAAVSSSFVLAAGQHQELELRLGEGGVMLSGRVLDEGGGPIPGAVVIAGPGFPWNAFLARTEPQRQFVATADEQGRYQLKLERREYALRVRAGGYLPIETTVAVTRAVSRDLRLGPAARVAGLAVVTGSGDPVPDAEVILAGPDRVFGSVATTRTDADGRFVIDDALGGAVGISVRHRARNLFGTKLVTTVPTQSLEGLQIELAPGVRLSGRVRDAGGTGIAGVAVLVTSVDVGLIEHARAVSGAEGGFALALASPGRYRVTAEAATASDPRGEVNVSVGTKGDSSTELVLARPPKILAVVGKVISPAGTAVSGVLVRAQVDEGRGIQQAGAAESDEKGHFRIVGVPGKPLQLMGWHPSEGIGEVPVDPSLSPSPVELRLQAGARISGQVSFDDGAPAPGISVAVTRQEGVVVYGSDTTGLDGRFALTSLAPGRYTVYATRKTGPGNLWTSREQPWLRLVEVEAGETEDDVQLEVKRGGRMINGTVTMPDGQPAVGAQVVANRLERGRSWKPRLNKIEHKGTVDDQGRFTLDDVEDEEFALWASLPGLPDATASKVRAGSGDVVLVFPPSSRIAGTVVDRGGRPVPAFHLSAIPTKTDSETPQQRDRRDMAERARPDLIQDPQGRFQVEGLLPGTYHLKVTTADGSGVARQTISLANGEQKVNVRVVAGDGVQATGRVVVLETGKPIASLNVRCHVAGRYVEAKTGADGAFAISGLIPGEPVSISTSFIPGLVPEFAELVVPTNVATVDLGTWKLMAGDWQAADRHGGTVGLRMGIQAGKPVVSATAPGKPAAVAGVKEGDQLLAIDGRDVTGLGAGATTYLTHRPPGSNLMLTVKSPGGDARVVSLTAVKQ